VFDGDVVVFEWGDCSSRYFGIYQGDQNENKDRPLYDRLRSHGFDKE
jgi:hypothetical protein